MYANRFDSLPPSPFPRLTQLLAAAAPGEEPLDLAIGEPKHAPPPFLRDALDAHFGDYNRYPPALGSADLRAAIADWIATRYSAPGIVDPERHVIPVCGSREGLFNIALVCVPESGGAGPRPAVLMPNPFYQCYAVAAVAAGAEPVYLDTPRAQGFLPDLDALDEALLERTALFYFCSPANPQGAIAALEDLKRLIVLARRFDFTVLFDECYSEIYLDEPPPGAIEAVRDLGGSLDHVVIFNSLSKRSNLAGLRSGFCVGDADILAAYLKFRNLAAPQLPLPVQAASAVCWRDEAHVHANRARYQAKIRDAQTVLGGRFGFYPPPGGFFLWLDMSAHGGGEAAALTAWRGAGLRILPGAYLARQPQRGADENAAYVRIALVHDEALTADALRRLERVLVQAH
jgi:aspartate/methionine/tyrosine aminotransferase